MLVANRPHLSHSRPFFATAGEGLVWGSGRCGTNRLNRFAGFGSRMRELSSRLALRRRRCRRNIFDLRFQLHPVCFSSFVLKGSQSQEAKNTHMEKRVVLNNTYFCSVCVYVCAADCDVSEGAMFTRRSRTASCPGA